MTRRSFLLGAGLFLFGVAIVEMVVPGLVPVPVGDAAVPITGGIVLLYAYVVARSRRWTELGGVETPDPERRPPVPTPGDDVDDALRQFLDPRTAYPRRQRRRGLQEAAIAVLTRYDDCSEAAARQRIEGGTWTENPRAAAFLGGFDAPSRGIATRIGDRLRGTSQYERDVRHTVAAIAAIAGVSTADDDRVRPGGSDGSRWPLVGTSGSAVPTDSETVAESVRTTIDAPSSGSVETDGSGVRSDGTAAAEESASTIRLGTRRPTHHWSGVGLVALVAIGTGLLVEQPGVLLAGVVGVGYAAYARSTTLGEVELSVDRSLENADPEPGDTVAVTVTVTNDSDRFLPDLRVVDGVPEGLAVTDGSPRCGTALRGGESTTFSYAISARRGRHEFQPTLVLARPLAGTIEQELTVEAASAVTCVPALRPTREPIPLREQASQYTGSVETSSGGEGVAFYSTRQYQHGDPMNRIDWHHHARTGELATLEFRQERAATVVLVVDVQSSAYVSSAPDGEHAVDRAVAAARRAFARLLDDGHRVGVATMGAPDLWLPPASGRDHRIRGRRLLATDSAFSTVPDPDDGFTLRWRRRLRRRLPEDAQVIVFSPLWTRTTVRSVRQFEATGHATTVVSPDPTADRTAGQQLARVYRAVAATDLRGAGIPVFDWEPEASIDEVLARGRYG